MEIFAPLKQVTPPIQFLEDAPIATVMVLLIRRTLFHRILCNGLTVTVMVMAMK